jgi:hypothetical protein
MHFFYIIRFGILLNLLTYSTIQYIRKWFILYTVCICSYNLHSVHTVGFNNFNKLMLETGKRSKFMIKVNLFRFLNRLVLIWFTNFHNVRSTVHDHRLRNRSTHFVSYLVLQIFRGGWYDEALGQQI